MITFRDHNPSCRTPYVTYALISMNCLIFLGYWGDLNNYRMMLDIYEKWALIIARIGQGQGFETLITSTFLHGGFWHLVGNMLFLHIYGDNLEDEMGHSKFMCFYLLCALAAGLIQIVSDPESSVPIVGASGAVAGVMKGYLFLYPKAKIDVLFIFVIFFKIFSLPAWVILGFWFALQLLNGFLVPSDAVGVAYWAHIGGFVAGLLLCWTFFQRRGGSNFWRDTDGRPPHPDAEYRLSSSRIPKIRRRPR